MTIDENHELDVNLWIGDTPWVDIVLFERIVDGEVFYEIDVLDPALTVLGKIPIPMINVTIDIRAAAA